MDTKIKISDFDLMGIVEIPEKEIDVRFADLVTLTKNNTYLSKSKKFWEEMSCSEGVKFRNTLSEFLKTNNLSSKNTFVLLDYMSNISGKVYYKACEDFINGKTTIGAVNKVKQCLFEDVNNIINLIEKNSYNRNISELMYNSSESLPTRNIECNNMALLYVFAKSLMPPKNYSVLNAGLGGVFIGPFFKSIYNIDWTNVLKSKYVKSETLQISNIMDRIVDKNMLSSNILFLDDNVGTGDTMREVKQELQQNGYRVKCGAVQYNWINYYRVFTGEKSIAKFETSDIDYVTQFNYPGHKLLEHVIDIFKGVRDCDGELIAGDNCCMDVGENYRKYKERKHYFDNDLIALQDKSKKYAGMANISLNIDEKSSVEKHFNKDSIVLMTRMQNIINESYKMYEDKEM